MRWLCYAPHMPRWMLVIAALLAVACSDRSPRPAGPSAASPLPIPPPNPIAQVSGRAVATVTGEPLGAVAVELGILSTTTSATGTFAFEIPGVTGATARLLLRAPGIVDRSLMVSIASSREIAVDAIVHGSGFDLDYYRRLVRRAVDQPEAPLPLRRWTRAPRVYLKTVDEGDQPIDPETLRQTEMAIGDEASAWTGGRFGVAEIVRGVETREGNPEWVTIKWLASASTDYCGRAQVGTPGGWIELNYLYANCGCRGSRISPGIVRHELGHALGFFHTGESGDALSGLPYDLGCNGRPSPRERFHAAIAYSRPVGNLDPDTDPGTTIQRVAGEPIVIVD